jgi:hypothetical protein
MSLRGLVAGIALAAAVLSGSGAGIAAAQQPIRPGQHFIGLVNGSHVDPEVTVVCPGPIYPGRTGPVAGGQTFAVAHAAAGGGYTGPFSTIRAWFVPPSASPASAAFPPELTFSEYGVPQVIPSSLQVPCYGTGEVEFSPCPYLAPCAAGWSPDYVPVRFVDIAA